jgi:uncharacterized protein
MKTEKFYIEETKDKGKGLFAKRNIKKGELIFIREDRKIYAGKNIQSSDIKESHFMQVGKNKFMQILPPGCYGNHSCDPNCGIKEDKTFALKDIEKDEEITVDYDTFEYDWKMWCKCGSENCRKILRGYKYLSKELRKKYKGYIQEYLLKSKTK